jgi:hypothetical protein
MAYKQERVTDYIRTYTGKKFYPLEPRPEDICIEDISHALSRIVRFTGHCEKLYTVGEHSIRCAFLAHDEGYSVKLQLYALLHDASEAYCSDVNRPLKQNLPEYIKIEDNVMDKVWEHFNLPKPTEEEYRLIKLLDNTLLINEMKQLMKQDYNDVNNMYHLDRFIDVSAYIEINSIKNTFNLLYDNLLDKYKDEQKGLI